MSAGYGRSKPGRPKIIPIRLGPACDICRNLECYPQTVCGKGHELDAQKCGAFSSAAIERPMRGGISGVIMSRAAEGNR